MKVLASLLTTAVLAFGLGEFLPWWSVAVAAFAVALFFRQPPFAAFLGGFAGIAILWSAYGFWLDKINESILAERVAYLFPLQGNPLLLVVFTGIIGGLVGGLAALTANFLVSPKLRSQSNQNYYHNKNR